LVKNYCSRAAFKIISIQTVVPMAAKATTAAAIAKILSIPLTVGAAGADVTGRRTAGAAGAAAVGRDWATGAADDLKGGALVAGCGIPLEAPVGPPGGNVGSLMVGAAVGLGGKLMRTVSFLG
jgi:hypothetical protein